MTNLLSRKRTVPSDAGFQVESRDLNDYIVRSMLLEAFNSPSDSVLGRFYMGLVVFGDVMIGSMRIDWIDTSYRVWNSVRWRWIGFTYWLDSHKHFRD